MKSFEPKAEEKKAVEAQKYAAPEIVLEIDLETRAGTVLSADTDPLDLTGIDTGTELFP